MSDVKLGSLINGPKVRDAIHVAVAPVVATEKLMPGQHIGFAQEGQHRKGEGLQAEQIECWQPGSADSAGRSPADIGKANRDC